MQSPTHGSERVRRADAHRFIEIVAPGLLDDPSKYEERLYLEVQNKSEKKWGWTHPKDLPEGSARLWALEHLAGGGGLPVEWWGDRPVRCAGLSVPPDARTEYVWLDLDGGYPLSEVVAAWCKKFNGTRYHMLTPGSGREGRYRLWFRLLEPLEVRKVRPTVHALMRELGFPPRNGYLEVYPNHKHQSRLPLGQGGCVRFGNVYGDAVPRATPMHPFALLEAAENLRPVNLRGYERGPQKRRKRNKGSAQADRQRRKGEGSFPSMVRSWLKHGANVGERRDAMRELIVACHHAGFDRERAMKFIAKKAGHVFGRTRGWMSARAQAATLREVDRVIHIYYDRYKQALPRPEHLTRRDVARLLKRALKAATPELSASAIFIFHLRVLPLVRAAYRAGLHPVKDRIIDETRTQIRIHSDDFKKAALGLGASYIALRDSLGLFIDAGLGYLPMKRARRPGDARCKTWRTRFSFDEGPSPRRPILGDGRRKRFAPNVRIEFDNIVARFSRVDCGGLSKTKTWRRALFTTTKPRRGSSVRPPEGQWGSEGKGASSRNGARSDFRVPRWWIRAYQHRGLSPPDADPPVSLPELYPKSGGMA
jgi:hypothetical protein